MSTIAFFPEGAYGRAHAAIRDRLAAASTRLQSHGGTARAAERIEAVATRC